MVKRLEEPLPLILRCHREIAACPASRSNCACCHASRSATAVSCSTPLDSAFDPLPDRWSPLLPRGSRTGAPGRRTR